MRRLTDGCVKVEFLVRAATVEALPEEQFVLLRDIIL